MAKHKRNVWDELVEVGRRIMNEIDDFMDPKAQRPRIPARVPAPVRKRRERYERD